jgi:hypothetical protein
MNPLCGLTYTKDPVFGCATSTIPIPDIRPSAWAPRERKVDYVTEPRSKDERRCYGTHDTQLVSQQFDSGAIGENRPAKTSVSGIPTIRHVTAFDLGLMIKKTSDRTVGFVDTYRGSNSTISRADDPA